MKKLFSFTVAAIISIGAQAGPATDAFSKCLADSTTGRDRTNLARWLLASMALHPAMKDIAEVSPATLASINKSAGLLYNRLMTEDCSNELKTARQTDGNTASGSGFELLGRLAFQELTANPQVSANFSAPVKYVDIKKIDSLIQPQ